MTHQTALELPGLEAGHLPSSGSELRDAVAQTIRALQQDKLLLPRHAGLCQLALEMADSVAAGRRSGRASAAAMAAAQLRETLEALPSPAASTQEDQWATYLAKLDAAVAAGHQVHTHGPSEGLGTRCPEHTLTDGRLLGACMLEGVSL